MMGLLGALLLGLGLVQGGWMLLAVWLGLNFLALAFAHLRGNPHLFGKRADGSLPLWSWVVFFPLLALTLLLWHLGRLSTEAKWNKVNDQLFVGRRLLGAEVPDAFENYVDLTSEFSEPGIIRRGKGYRLFPILDASAPTAEALLAFVKSLGPGKTFIHCAQGHGRTGLVALAVLMVSGAAENVESGLQTLKAARPGINLSKKQLQCAEDCAIFVQNHELIPFQIKYDLETFQNPLGSGLEEEPKEHHDR